MRATMSALVLVSSAVLGASCSGGDEFESGSGARGGVDGGGAAGGKAGSGSGGASGSSGAAGAGASAGASGSAGSGGVSGSSGSASGGDSGNGNSGGTGSGGSGTGGANGTGGAGGTGGASSGGTGGGAPCNWNADTCPNGTFCNALGCADGTCAPLPNEGIQKNPVCGCDGISYWNASVAGARGMSVKSVGACLPGKTCGGIAQLDCPGNESCNYEVPDLTGCNISDFGGTCWVVPASCTGGVGFGPNTRGCDENFCTDECVLIRSQKPFYRDNTCPV